MAFTRRSINLRFQLGTGSFGEDGADTVQVSGVRASANITKSGGVSMSQLDLRVWGLPLDVMNKLTVLNILAQNQARRNVVTVSAGDDASGLAVCFTGIVKEAWADMSSPPDAVFVVTAFTGLLESVRPVPPVSYSGTVDAATVLAGICAQNNPVLTLENSGVSVQIATPYWPGSTLDQIRAVARAGQFNVVLDDNNVLAIWPKGGARGQAVTLLSAATGMVGYPAFTQSGIQVTSLYNPSLVFGQTVEVDSLLTPANGRWTIAAISHNLDTETPGGQWFTRIDCGLLGGPTPIVE